MSSLPLDVATPVVISHLTFLGIKQLKRVDRVDVIPKDAPPHPAVLRALGLPSDVALVRLVGDTVDKHGHPVGHVRGWQTYARADEPLEIVEVVP